MAVRRKPLSARVISILRAKAKGRKNITLGMLKKVYRRGQGAFLGEAKGFPILRLKTKNFYGRMVYG